mgnify:CR=1 FL=1
MTTHIIRAAAVFSLLISFAAVTADAQSRRLIKADIPFSFQLKDTVHTAGEYLIEKAAPTAENRAVILRRKTGESIGMVNMLPLKGNGKPAGSAPLLIFNQYGSTRVLSEIHAPSEGFYGRIRKTKKETELAQTFGEPKLTTIVAK